MRLFQNQIYQRANDFIRIVRLDRYEVDFKSTTGEPQGDGEITTLKKKEFCRLIKGMTLLDPPAKDEAKK